MRKELLGSALALLACLGCGDVGPDTLRRCPYEKDSSWPSTTFYTNIPQGCPLSLQEPRETTFHTVAIFPQSSVQPPYYFLEVSNGYHVVQLASSNKIWTTEANGDHKLDVNGSYMAGTAGFNLPAAVDYLKNTILLASGAYSNATVRATYQLSIAPVSLNAPEEVMPWTSYEVNADVNDPSWVPPISYSWTRNGVSMGITSDSFIWNGDAMGVDNDFEVTIQDAEGRTATLMRHVHTKNCDTPGCMDM